MRCIKGFAHTDEPTKNYHLNVQYPSASQSFIVSFSSNFTILAHGSRLTALIVPLFWGGRNRQLLSVKQL